MVRIPRTKMVIRLEFNSTHFFLSFHIKHIGDEKKFRFDQSFWEFSEKLYLNNYNIKNIGGIKMKILKLKYFRLTPKRSFDLSAAATRA